MPAGVPKSPVMNGTPTIRIERIAMNMTMMNPTKVRGFARRIRYKLRAARAAFRNRVREVDDHELGRRPSITATPRADPGLRTGRRRSGSRLPQQARRE